MSNFNLVKLEDLVQRVKVGFVGQINEFYCEEKDGIPLIRTTDLNESGINYSNIKFVTKEFHKKNKKSQIRKGDVLIARHGDNGKASVFKGDFEAQVLNAVIIEPNQDVLDSELIKLFFESPYVKKQILGVVKGSVQGVINTSHVANLLIPLNQDIDYRQASKTISLLDRKIELNQRINAELEAMAKTLYDYWFVQFDFPNQKGKPYKSAGGKMVWNEALKREIPLGWEVGELGDILSLEYGKPLKDEDRSGSGYPVLGSNGIVGYHKEYLVEGYGIVVGRKGTAGAVVWVEDNFYPIDTAFYVKDKLGINNLFFHYLLLLRSSIKQGESSSAVPGLNRNFAHSIKVAIPEKSIIQDFNKIVEPFFSKIKTCNKESQTLTELRDWLLPMLMNGQVRVMG